MPFVISTYHKLEKINEAWSYEKGLEHVGINMKCGCVEQKSWKRQYVCECVKLERI